MFRKAQRNKVRLKVGISAPSGAGKTYSALLIAYGICGDWSKVAVIDTENGSAELYSHLGEYSVCRIDPPYTPKKYIEAIEAAKQEGFEVLIIDSLSHAWSGEGGLLDMQDKIAKASKSGNSYTAWRDVTPEHNRLVDAIIHSDIDVIVTTRAKAEYVISDAGNGKKEIRKVGLAPVFRDGLEYELTVFFDLTQEHLATASKDRTGLFDGQTFVPTSSTGKLLSKWREEGMSKTGNAVSETAQTEKRHGITIDELKAFGIVDTKGMESYLLKKMGKPMTELSEEETEEVWEFLKRQNEKRKKSIEEYTEALSRSVEPTPFD